MGTVTTAPGSLRLEQVLKAGLSFHRLERVKNGATDLPSGVMSRLFQNSHALLDLSYPSPLLATLACVVYLVPCSLFWCLHVRTPPTLCARCQARRFWRSAAGKSQATGRRDWPTLVQDGERDGLYSPSASVHSRTRSKRRLADRDT